MAVVDEIDRFHLAQAVVERVSHLSEWRREFASLVMGKLAEHAAYIRQQDDDMP